MKFLKLKNYKELQKGDILFIDGLYRRIINIKTTAKLTTITFSNMKKRIKNIETNYFKTFEEQEAILTESKLKMINHFSKKGHDREWLRTLSECALEELYYI